MSNIIRTIITVVLSTVICGTTTAQEQKKQHPTRGQLAQTQARHIADDMAFDEATSKKFIETYTNCQKEIWAVGPRQEKRNYRKDGQQNTDEQSEKVIKERFAQSKKILEIREKYYGEYSKFLTQKQIERVYQIEKQMMNRLAKHGKGKPSHTNGQHNRQAGTK